MNFEHQDLKYDFDTSKMIKSSYRYARMGLVGRNEGSPINVYLFLCYETGATVWDVRAYEKDRL